MTKQRRYNTINEIIRKRKSIRKYDFTSLDASTLKRVREKIKNVNPLYSDIKYSIEIVSKTKGMFSIKAPHYLIFGSEEMDGAYENIGFIGQQLDLFFSEAGLGSCWLGGSKPEEKEESPLPFVICIAFGKPVEPLHRTTSELKRKPLNEISEGMDERLDVARLAPSAANAQNWYFVAENNQIHCYRKKANALLCFYNKLHSIGMGIALCHISTESIRFNFGKEPNVPERKGYVYMGTINDRTD